MDQKSHTTSNINPAALTECLLTCLNERERKVIERRHALHGSKKETLESIGQEYDITRERVRQIERASLNKIKRLVDYKVVLQELVVEIDMLLQKFGGIIAHHHLIEEIGERFKDPHTGEINTHDKNRVKFLIEEFMPEFFHFHKAGEHHKEGWAHTKEHLESIKAMLARIEEFLEKEAKTVSHEHIAAHLGKSADPIYSSLHLSKRIGQNPFGEWGMMSWSEVNPKRMSDRIFVVLKKYAKPLHYKEIAQAISTHYHKKVHPPTVHNELIADPRFVLVGRGIYALKDWGYVAGTVGAIVESVIAESNTPLTRDEIIERVKKQRLVARSTILLALNTNKNIEKVEKDHYRLKQ